MCGLGCCSSLCCCEHHQLARPQAASLECCQVPDCRMSGSHHDQLPRHADSAACAVSMFKTLQGLLPASRCLHHASKARASHVSKKVGESDARELWESVCAQLCAG